MPYQIVTPSHPSKITIRITDLGLNIIRNHILGFSLTPASSSSGSAGKLIEQRLIQLFDPKCRNIMSNSGVDVLEYFLEFKSQNVNTNSSLTVGHMTASDIIQNTYYSSSLSDKLQAHLQISHDGQVVTDAELFYYDNPVYQALFEKVYNDSKNELVKLLSSRTGSELLLGTETFIRTKFKRYQTLNIPDKQFGYFERNQTNTGFNFRIPQTGKTKVNQIANSTYIDLFSEYELQS